HPFFSELVEVRRLARHDAAMIGADVEPADVVALSPDGAACSCVTGCAAGFGGNFFVCACAAPASIAANIAPVASVPRTRLKSTLIEFSSLHGLILISLKRGT